MRFHATSAFAAAKNTWEAANTAFLKYIDQTDLTFDQECFGPEAVAEREACDAVLGFPASTPAEIAGKLSFMREREAGGWNGYSEWMGQVERELIELQRPCVSPVMAAAFQAWSRANHAHYHDTIGEDEHDNKLCDESGAAFLTLMALPCFTPGDLIAKLYVEELGQRGATYRQEGWSGRDPFGFAFEPEGPSSLASDASHDIAAHEAFVRDLHECDLGRCMMALGRVDFDAAAWLDASRRAQMTVHVVIQPDGSRWLFTGEPDGEVSERHAERFYRCQALLGAGMGVIGNERRASVIDHIVEHEPKLVIDCRQPIEAVA